jgi:hypothetical protein
MFRHTGQGIIDMRAIHLLAVLAATVMAAAGAPAQEMPAVTPVLPEKSVVPLLGQHDKPNPFPVLPMWDLGWGPAEMPYRMDKLRPGPGVLASLMNSSAPVKLGGGYGGTGNAKEAFGQATYRAAQGAVS